MMYSKDQPFTVANGDCRVLTVVCRIIISDDDDFYNYLLKWIL